MKTSKDPTMTNATSPEDVKNARSGARIAIIIVAGAGALFFLLYLLIVVWSVIGSSG
jgi:hypothetical protein